VSRRQDDDEVATGQAHHVERAIDQPFPGKLKSVLWAPEARAVARRQNNTGDDRDRMLLLRHDLAEMNELREHRAYGQHEV
jgi:hypothetical protein